MRNFNAFKNADSVKKTGMAKRLITLFATLIFSLCLVVVPAFATQYVSTDVYVADATLYYQLQTARRITNRYGINAFLLYSEEEKVPGAMITEFVEANELRDRYLITAFSGDSYWVDWSYDLEGLFTEENVEDLVYETIEFDDNDNVVYNVPAMAERYYSYLDSYLYSSDVFPYYDKIFGEEANPSNYRYVADQAGVLTDTEEKDLNDYITDVREKIGHDIVIVTANGIDPSDRMAFADDYFDYNGYGYGENKNGALLLVNIGDDGVYSKGNSWISTSGSTMSLISDSTVQKIGEKITPMLLDGKYHEAFSTYINFVGNKPKQDRSSELLKIILTCVGLSLIAAFIWLFIELNKLKSVADAREADLYLKEGTLDIRRSYDHYVYSTVTKTEIKSESSGGGHTSSSGSSHGGGGF
ncbi:MAG: TPM domain-containing protein [Eubacteriales bacterium]|nr:TPM domain-containing protein [Eubacteriales bacterium]